MRTVAHLRPEQVWHRLRLSARRGLVERFAERVGESYRRRAASFETIRFDAPGLARVAALRLAQRTTEDRLSTARDVLEGRFRFLNRTEDLGDPVAWHHASLQSGTRLWKTCLHEFPYAMDLALAVRETGDPRYRARLFDLIAQWSRASPLGHPGFALDSWNARALSTRMIHWLLAGSILELAPEDRETRGLSEAIAVHALFLRDNLELDLLGNHLLRNAVGLVFAHAALGGFPGGLELLERQVEEQVLADGCHYERTPLYQAVVLQDLLETRELLGREAPSWLVDAVERMAGFLRYLVGDTGRLPLMGDSWLGEVEVGALLAVLPSGKPRRAAAEDPGGLVVLSRGATRAILRAGPHGPDHQLGHAHADLLSFEATHAATPIVVDTGGGLYDPGEGRQRLRSTAAHNTIAIDDEEQIEAWGSFRVGRRGRARVVSLGGSREAAWCWARHDAYRWLSGGPIHQRLLVVADGMILVLDAVTGAGGHGLASYLHFHPEAERSAVKTLSFEAGVTRRAVPLFQHFNQPQKMTEISRQEVARLPWTSGWLILVGERWDGGDAKLESEPDRVRARYDTDGVRLEASWRYAEPAATPEVTVRYSHGAAPEMSPS